VHYKYTLRCTYYNIIHVYSTIYLSKPILRTFYQIVPPTMTMETITTVYMDIWSIRSDNKETQRMCWPCEFSCTTDRGI